MTQRYFVYRRANSVQASFSGFSDHDFQAACVVGFSTSAAVPCSLETANLTNNITPARLQRAVRYGSQPHVFCLADLRY